MNMNGIPLLPWSILLKVRCTLSKEKSSMGKKEIFKILEVKSSADSEA